MGVFPLLLFISIISMIESQCLTANDSLKTDNENSGDLIDAKFDFALDSLEKLSLIEAKNNIVFSPRSIYESLTLAYFGAQGDTKFELKKVLKIPDKFRRIDVYRSYVHDNSTNRFFGSSGNYEFRAANRVYISSLKNVRKCMLKIFGSAELKKIDFKSRPSAAQSEINNWVNDTTKGQIHNLIQSGDVDASADLISVSAAYFHGFWKKPFHPRDTQQGDFLYESKSSPVTFMVQHSKFNYTDSSDLASQVLQMPYKDENISMFVFLPGDSIRNSPDNDHGINDLIKLMKTEIGKKTLRDILTNGMPPSDVWIFLPRFTIEKNLPMNLLLDKIGAGKLLRNNSANFRSFVPKNVHLDRVIHRAKINNEEGGTSEMPIPMTEHSKQSYQFFVAYYPFVYIIYDKMTQSVLFTGIYRKPDE